MRPKGRFSSFRPKRVSSSVSARASENSSNSATCNLTTLPARRVRLRASVFASLFRLAKPRPYSGGTASVSVSEIQRVSFSRSRLASAQPRPRWSTRARSTYGDLDPEANHQIRRRRKRAVDAVSVPGGVGRPVGRAPPSGSGRIPEDGGLRPDGTSAQEAAEVHQRRTAKAGDAGQQNRGCSTYVPRIAGARRRRDSAPPG
jgi:hypothetical protein